MTSDSADVQDIVERLRDDNSDHPYTERHEAADEIERLRAALQQSRSAVDALERIKSATANEVRAGCKGYVSRYGIHGIASKALSQESADA